MAVSRKATGALIYQLRIELQDLKPAIWRSVLVPASIKLSTLHVVLLRTMGWMGGHLHEFIIGHTHYGEPDPDFPQSPPVLREERNNLANSLGALKTFRYLYDFGDGWEHKVRVEKILPPETPQRACRSAWPVRMPVHLKMSAGRQATSSSSRLSPIRVTRNTRRCSIGAVARSTRTPST